MPLITTISGQSTIYVTSGITAPADPTSDTVAFAFLGPYGSYTEATAQTVTSTTTFTTGSWGTTQSYPTLYIAQCLVGPSGDVTLTTGSYAVWVKITSSPEVPILYSGPLVVT